MSKKFKGKVCVYCSDKASTTADHIIARQFLLEKERRSLPQAPACSECNNSKSALEHYLATVLPFGGRHQCARMQLESMVPPRLAKNMKLQRQLSDGMDSAAICVSEGVTGVAMTIPFDSERLLKLFSLIARGLLWHHWKTYLGQECSAQSQCLTESGAALYDQIFKRAGPNHVNEQLGGGTFVYEGVQQRSKPQVSAWRFLIYGGLALTGDPEALQESTSQVLVITGIENVIPSGEAAPDRT